MDPFLRMGQTRPGQKVCVCPTSAISLAGTKYAFLFYMVLDQTGPDRGGQLWPAVCVCVTGLGGSWGRG